MRLDRALMGGCSVAVTLLLSRCKTVRLRLATLIVEHFVHTRDAQDESSIRDREVAVAVAAQV